MKHHQDHEDEDLPPSKTRRKKDMIAQQKLGEELLELNRKQLAAMNLPDQLLAALQEMDRIPNSHEARRRHLQFIGRVMRDCDHEAIQQQLDRLRTPDISQVRRAQNIELWGGRLLEGGEETIGQFIEQFPMAERQTLRQIQRNYSNALSRDEAESRVQRRKLLDYIKTFIN